jgi:hypothetical protein
LEKNLSLARKVFYGGICDMTALSYFILILFSIVMQEKNRAMLKSKEKLMNLGGRQAKPHD